MCRGTHSTSVQAVDIIRPVGMELQQKRFSSGPFWTQKIKPKATYISDRITSTTPGAEPPRDARDSGSARSHSTHLETSSSDRP